MTIQQPTVLRADRVSDADMQELCEAKGKIVDYDGRTALLDFEVSVSFGHPKENAVILDFRTTAGERATVDVSAVLKRLPFKPC